MTWWVRFISIPNASRGRHLMGHLIKSRTDIGDLDAKSGAMKTVPRDFYWLFWWINCEDRSDGFLCPSPSLQSRAWVIARGIEMGRSSFTFRWENTRWLQMTEWVWKREGSRAATLEWPAHRKGAKTRRTPPLSHPVQFLQHIFLLNCMMLKLVHQRSLMSAKLWKLSDKRASFMRLCFVNEFLVVVTVFLHSLCRFSKFKSNWPNVIVCLSNWILIFTCQFHCDLEHFRLSNETWPQID